MSKVIKIIAISDTHNKQEYLTIPECDVLIHAGDATALGTIKEFFAFISWFSKLKANLKIYVPGNHDIGLSNMDKYVIEDMCRQHNIVLLNNQEYVYDGIKFYGTPYSLKYGANWAFMKEQDVIKEEWDKIPLDTNILVVHGPPYQILDSIIENKLTATYDDYYSNHNAGCRELAKSIEVIKPSMVVFGHIHEQGNAVLEKNDVVYMNASCLNGQYQVRKKHYIQTNLHYEVLDGKVKILYVDYRHDTQEVRG